MARNADIRLHLVTLYPSFTLWSLLVTATAFREEITNQAKRFSEEDGPFDIRLAAGTDKGIKGEFFKLESPTKYSNQAGMVFTTAGLDAFISELNVYTTTLGMGDQTFCYVITGADDDIMYAVGNDKQALAIINAEIYSALIRRFQNRGRVGSGNPHTFRYTFKDDTTVLFTLDRIIFGAHELQYRLRADTEILSNAIGGQKVFHIPMPVFDAVVYKALNDAVKKLSSYDRLVEVINQNTLDGMVDFGYDQADKLIEKAIDVLAGQVGTNPKGPFKDIIIHNGPYEFAFFKLRSKDSGYHFDFEVRLEGTPLGSPVRFKLNDIIKTAPARSVTIQRPSLEIDKFFSKFVAGDEYIDILEWLNTCTRVYEGNAYIGKMNRVLWNSGHNPTASVEPIHQFDKTVWRARVTVGNVEHQNLSDFTMRKVSVQDSKPVVEKVGFFSRVKQAIFG